MIQDVQNELSSSIEKAHDALKRDLGKLRTGRAHPGMLDSVRVSYYGTPTPIAQMAAVNVPEPRMISIVDAFDAMTSDYVYRRAMSRERAVAELFDKAGT